MVASEKSTVSLDSGTRLAVSRTLLAHDRTLMAWVRTAVSLISFGFTIYKFFQLELSGRPQVGGPIGPREFALAMILIGLVALLFAGIQHRQSIQSLRAEYGADIPFSLAGIMAGLFSVVGLFALVAVLLRL
jgi:putative membrane protein